MVLLLVAMGGVLYWGRVRGGGGGDDRHKLLKNAKNPCFVGVGQIYFCHKSFWEIVSIITMIHCNHLSPLYLLKAMFVINKSTNQSKRQVNKMTMMMIMTVILFVF